MSGEKRPIAISLFSGMGGLDLGVKKAGFKIALQVDIDKYCIKTLEKNWKHIPKVQADISKVSGRNLLKMAKLSSRKVDLVVGGPSCQPFSRSNEGKRLGMKDKRGKLVIEFSRLIGELRPRAFLMENVAGLLSSNKGKDFKKLLRSFRRQGYYVTYELINSAAYGLPQKRVRLFIVGFSKKTEFKFPKQTHGNDNSLIPFVNSGEVIGDLDEQIYYDGKKTIGGKYGHLLNKIPPGMNYLYYTERFNRKNIIFKNRSKFWTFLLKLDPEQPSPTIQARPGSFVGPFHWNNRRLTIKEIKRLQGIRDSYQVYGEDEKRSSTIAWNQVGNSVPPPIAYIITKGIRDQLQQSKSDKG